MTRLRIKPTKSYGFLDEPIKPTRVKLIKDPPKVSTRVPLLKDGPSFKPIEPIDDKRRKEIYEASQAAIFSGARNKYFPQGLAPPLVLAEKKAVRVRLEKLPPLSDNIGPGKHTGSSTAPHFRYTPKNAKTTAADMLFLVQMHHNWFWAGVMKEGADTILRLLRRIEKLEGND